ncbi:MAG: glycosyltransferase, partial [Terrimicrobiaceae bacterium]
RIIFICPATFEEFPGAAENRGTYSWIPQSSEIPVTGRDQLPAERDARLADQPPIRFGIIGRLTVEKGAEVMRDFAQTGGLDCEIHVAGSGPLEPDFRELAGRQDQPGTPVVRFHGAFDPTQRELFLRNFFNGIDYLVVSSQDEWETLSMAALEGMQHGVPAVICRTGGLKSFAHAELGPAPESVVRLVEPGALISTLVELAGNPRPSWDASGALCLAHYDRYFSNSAVLERWLSVLVG